MVWLQLQKKAFFLLNQIRSLGYPEEKTRVTYFRVAYKINKNKIFSLQPILWSPIPDVCILNILNEAESLPPVQSRFLWFCFHPYGR